MTGKGSDFSQEDKLGLRKRWVDFRMDKAHANRHKVREDDERS